VFFDWLNSTWVRALPGPMHLCLKTGFTPREHPAFSEETTAPTLRLEFLLWDWKGQASLKFLCTTTRQHVIISNTTVNLRLKHIFHSRIVLPSFFPIFDTKVPTLLSRIIH